MAETETSSNKKNKNKLKHRARHKKKREQLRKMYGKYRKKGGVKSQEGSAFEPCNAPQRPAVVEPTEFKLKWKDGGPPQPVEKEKEGEEEKVDFEEIQKTKEFQLARKLMIQLRTNNVLQTMIGERNLSAVSKFFKEELDSPSVEVIEIIDDAMEGCYSKLMFHQNEYNMVIDSDMREFLLNKEKAKKCLLDVILVCPEFIPLIWGGETVGVPTDDDGPAKAKPSSSEDSNAFVKSVDSDEKIPIVTAKQHLKSAEKASGANSKEKLSKESLDEKIRSSSQIKVKAISRKNAPKKASWDDVLENEKIEMETNKPSPAEVN